MGFTRNRGEMLCITVTPANEREVVDAPMMPSQPTAKVESTLFVGVRFCEKVQSKVMSGDRESGKLTVRRSRGHWPRKHTNSTDQSSDVPGEIVRGDHAKAVGLNPR